MFVIYLFLLFLFCNKSPLINSYYFQVHEKTILLVCLPVVLCFTWDPLPCLWFLQIATLSMTPLLIRDGLLFSYAVTTVAYLLIVRLVTNLEDPSSKRPSVPFDVLNLSTFTSKSYLVYAFYVSAVLGSSVLVAGLAFIPPPEKLPDLFPVLISAYCCVHFLAFFLYFNVRQALDFSEGDQKNVKADTKAAQKIKSANTKSKDKKKFE